MKLTTLKIKLLLLTLLPLLGACQGSGEEEPHPALLYNFCEVCEATDQETTFNLFRPDSDTPVTLTARGTSLADENGKFPDPGTSLLIAYYQPSGQPYSSGEINLKSWSKINNFTLKTPSEEEATDLLNNWQGEAVQLITAWRAGNKLYLRLRLPYSTLPRSFSLIADPETLADPLPVLYLRHDRNDQSPTFDRQYYFAFDISPVWQLSSVQGVKVMINDALASSTPSQLIFYKNP